MAYYPPLIQTSAQLAAQLSDETGSGSVVFATSPTLVTPLLGTPTSGNASNLTSFPTLNQNTTGSAATLTTSRNINGVAFNGSAAIVGPAVTTAGLFSVVNTGATNWAEGGTAVQANGTSTSGSAGTTVADLAAAANSQIVAWSAYAAQSNASGTQFTITITYSDTTTITATSSAATTTTAFANMGGILLNTAALQAGSSSKHVTEIKVITAGAGTGTRSAIISGLQVPL